MLLKEYNDNFAMLFANRIKYLLDEAEEQTRQEKQDRSRVYLSMFRAERAEYTEVSLFNQFSVRNYFSSNKKLAFEIS